MSQMNRRQALKLLAALGATGLAAGCGSDTEDASTPGSPIKIGLIVPGSGPNKAIGDEIANGFQLFLNINEQQLGGHPVTLVQAEEGDNKESGQAAVDRLLKEGVVALTGVVSSAVMSGIRDTVEQARVPLIGSNASPTGLQSVVYIWRTSYVLNEPGEALGQYLRETLDRSSRIVVFGPDNQSTRDVVAGLRRTYEQEGRRLADVVYTSDRAEVSKSVFASAIHKVVGKGEQPDAIFCHYSGTQAVQFIKQLYAEGYQGPIYGPGFLTEGSVLSQLDDGENGELRSLIVKHGIETALNYSADLNNTANRVFASAYRKTFNTSPTTYAMASYDAAQVLDKAIRLVSGEPTPQQINLALGKIGQIDSPRGPGSSTSRVPRSRSGTCARSSSTAGCCRTS